MPYTRPLKYQLPLMSGSDAIEIQMRLRDLGYAMVGQPDGIFGARTDSAVRAFQQAQGLTADGIVGPLIWERLFQNSERDPAFDKIRRVVDELKVPHSFMDSVTWSLGLDGVRIEGSPPETTGGEPKTVRGVWQSYSVSLEAAASKFGVPVELIIATICTETTNNPKAERQEPGYVSDERTPSKVSIGLMQTLISTARDALDNPSIDRAWLLEPSNAIQAGTAYIAQQWKVTRFDPPKVACAYNAGGLKHNQSKENRWKMLQYPSGKSDHADRFVKWFNDCFLMFQKDQLASEVSFYRLLQGA